MSKFEKFKIMGMPLASPSFKKNSQKSGSSSKASSISFSKVGTKVGNK